MGVTRVEDWSGDFDAIIDVRSPAEFADDHIPGALSLPALSNEERAKVGTIYKQVSAFEAKKVGAALISRNIATHIEQFFLDKPGGFRPLVYCWRGGQRSGSFALVLAEIGFRPHTLIGGYKRYRHDVLEQIETLPGQFQY
ncbi:MAG: rhodanese-like domain-containing protein, partial [Alphaproteobacteria bacterium]